MCHARSVMAANRAQHARTWSLLVDMITLSTNPWRPLPLVAEGWACESASFGCVLNRNVSSDLDREKTRFSSSGCWQWNRSCSRSNRTSDLINHRPKAPHLRSRRRTSRKPLGH